MQALSELRQLRADLETARIARRTMEQRGLALHGRSPTALAYDLVMDRIFETLARLDVLPMLITPESKPALAVFEEMLATIAQGEAVLRRMA